MYLYFFVFSRNSEKIVKLLEAGNVSRAVIPPHINFVNITAEDYNLAYDMIKKVKEGEFSALGLKPCLIEEELDKVRVILKSLKKEVQTNDSSEGNTEPCLF